MHIHEVECFHLHHTYNAGGENRTLVTGLENPRNSRYTTPAYRDRSLMRLARRRFSESLLLTMTNSGAVLCDQSIKPTNVVTREHATQVVVCGRASIRAGGITALQVSQVRGITVSP